MEILDILLALCEGNTYVFPLKRRQWYEALLLSLMQAWNKLLLSQVVGN